MRLAEEDYKAEGVRKRKRQRRRVGKKSEKGG